MITAVLFDLGGVVLDVDFARVLDAWARASGADAAILRQRFTTDEGYRRHERGEIDIDEYRRHCCAALGVELDLSTFTAGWNAIFGGVIPGMPELIRDAARRLPVACLSNTNATHEAEFMRRYGGTMALFPRRFYSHALGRRKPEAEAFLAACRALGAAPGETLMLDDSEEHVAGARAAGLRAERVRTRDEAAAALAACGRG